MCDQLRKLYTTAISDSVCMTHTTCVPYAMTAMYEHTPRQGAVVRKRRDEGTQNK